jgi:hypothetical protein
MKKKPKRLSIQKICDEIYKHRHDISPVDIREIASKVDDLRFDYARRQATEHVVEVACGLITASNTSGGPFDNETPVGKALHRAANKLEKELPEDLKWKVWTWS